MPTNINDATYFELRLTEEICRVFDIDFKYSTDLETAAQRTRASHGHDADEKIRIQERRLNVGIDTIVARIKTAESEAHFEITDAEWIGGTGRGTRVADIDLWFGSYCLPLSVKSGGPGTERNLGSSKLRSLLGFDASPAIAAMKSETLNALRSWFPTTDVGASWNSIRDMVKGHPEESVLRNLAARIGHANQILISAALKDAFESSTSQQKIEFVKFLALQNSSADEGLEIFVAHDNHAEIKSVKKDILGGEFSLAADENSAKGTLKLAINEEPYWRINVNFTNGLGLSPLAIRVFLL